MVSLPIRALAVSFLTSGFLFSVQAHAQSVIDPVQRRGFAIRDQFVLAIKACGVNPTAVPGVVVKTAPSMVSYTPSDRSVHLSRWAELDPPIQGMMTDWAANGTLGLKPEQMFGEIFNNLLVAHELGHYLQDMSGRLQKIDNWQSEVEANQIAIAFFSRKAKDAALLPTRVENFTRFLTALPNPVPKEQVPRSYFIKNYEKLSNNPEAYGWYQGAFMRTAWKSRKERNFCGWVSLNSPVQPSAPVQGN